MAKQRRVLGSPVTPQKVPSLAATQPSETPDSELARSPTPGSKQRPLSPDSSLQSAADGDHIECPICNEPMITVSQLNQHIDDIHLNADTPSVPASMSPLSANSLGKLFNNEFIKNDIKKWFNGDTEPPKDEADTETTPQKRKTIKLDLFEGSKAFGLSDTNLNEQRRQDRSPTPLNKPRVTRAHWKRPSSNGETVCHFKGCRKPLNVRNGIVNCRKCGELYCNEHTNFKARLENPKRGEPEPQYDVDGIWSRVCERCFYNKPSMVVGTQVNVNDLTSQFRKVRATKLEENQLVADKVIKKFIRLVNLLTEAYLSEEAQQPKGFFDMFQGLNVEQDTLIEHQKQIVGYENWQEDSLVHNCFICFTKFSFLVRKHHCRLCGRIVCDDSLGERKDCSLLVPIQLLMSKLSYLNYSVQVKKHFDEIVESQSNIFVTRICRVCKDNVLHDYRVKLVNSKQQEHDERLERVFKLYSQSLILKHRLQKQLPEYDSLVVSSTLQASNVFKDKVMGNIKQFQQVVTEFKKTFLVQNEVNVAYKQHTKLIMTINKALVLFLQQALMQFKEANNRLKDKENEQLPKKEPAKPRLTKKQIRELRDSLMVMNEQRFLIENMIQEATKQRKFDELQTLNNSRDEISKEIEKLEAQLGEFGF